MKKIAFFLSIALMLISFTSRLSAQNSVIYSFDKKIALPGEGGYDYLSIDAENNKLYVSHGTSVNVVDLATEQVVGEIKDMKGVHGIAIDNELNRGFISDGRDNSVVVFDLKTYAKLATVPVKASGPDAIMYDPFGKKVYSFNGDSKNASVVDAKTMKQVGTVDLLGGPEFAVTNGDGKIYNNIEDLNTLKVIDAATLKVISEYVLSPCSQPTGLGADFGNGRLFTACRKNKGMSVLDMKTGKVITTLPIGAGVDAVAYDPATKLVFCSCGDGTTTIIKQENPDTYTVVQTLKTENRAKTMALDLKTHKIYLSAPTFEEGTRKMIPGGFHLLVYKMN